METLPIMVALMPTLVSVTVCSLDTPTATPLKLNELAERLLVVPMPLSGTGCGLFEALSVMLRIAVRAPRWVGCDAICTVQLAPGATVLAQELARAKSPGSRQ